MNTETNTKEEFFFSLAPIVRIMKSTGAKKISKDAKIYMRKYLAEYGILVAKEATKLCEYAKRDTILEDDIKLAAKRIRSM